MPTTEPLNKRLWRTRKKLAANFLPFAVIAICFALIIGKLQVEEAMVNLRTMEVNAVAQGVSTITRGMDHMPRDIRFLYLLNEIPAIVGKPSDNVLRQLESIFIDFLNASGTYSQARWIDATGQEQVRVDHTGKWTWIVPYNSLQMKNHRYYFQETMKLPNNGIYVSPMDLNIEHNKIALPFEPTLRVATPVFDTDGNRKGILILNQNMSDTLELLAEISSFSPLTLVNEQGFWLKGENSDDEWGHSLNKPKLSLAVRNPKAWQRISGLKEGQFEDTDGLWTYRRVELLPDKLINLEEYLLLHPSLTIVSRIPAGQLIELRHNVAIPTLSLLAVILIALFLFSASRALSYHAQIEARQQITAKVEELSQANAQLEKAYATLRLTQDELIRSEKLSALGLMVAGVAHEINTPLGAALVAVSKLQSAGSELEHRFAEGLRRSDLEAYLNLQREGMELASRNLKRAAKLISNFKQLAADRANDDRHLFNLNELVNECLLLFINPAKHAYIEFTVDIAPDIKMDSYPGPLSQILHNLINNAITHAFGNRPGGLISISASNGDKPGFLRIDVADNGEGIDQESLKRIFDPFYTTRRGKGGMGLGLHLSHHIAKELLGARLTVSSKLEQGTCFTLQIPLQAPEQTDQT